MAVFPALTQPVPDFWTIFGHSYMQYNFGTRTQAGRADAVFRATLDVEHTNFVNHAANGSRLSIDGLPNAGWARVMQNMNGYQSGAPYVGQGGAYLLGWGINDLGFNTDTAQFRTNYQMSLRAVISRCRMSTRKDDDIAAGIVYGSGFTSLAFSNDFSSGPTAAPGWATIRQCTTTGVNATFTITLPSDYTGAPICIALIANGGPVGGTVTWSGTAGVTGTTSTSDLVPAALSSRAITVKRITTLTSANASQTIIGTVSAIDASGTVFFDSYWIESETPNPVIVCNIAKLTATGYAVYSPAPTDAQVDTWNGLVNTVVAEFDSMVQVADIDSAIAKATLGVDAKTPTLAFDGLHPTEYGAGRIADAILLATKRLQPSTKMGGTVHMNPQSARRGAITEPRVNGEWYQPEAFPNVAGTAYTPVSGDFWAMPFCISDGQSKITRWSITMGSTNSPAMSLMLALYDDRQLRGYPQYMHAQPASSTALVLSTGAGTKLSVTSTGNGFIDQPLDPGLYWWGMKVIATGTSATVTTQSGQSPYLPNNSVGALSVCNAWKITGQGTGALPGMFPPGASKSTNGPVIGFQITQIGQP